MRASTAIVAATSLLLAGLLSACESSEDESSNGGSHATSSSDTSTSSGPNQWTPPSQPQPGTASDGSSAPAPAADAGASTSADVGSAPDAGPAPDASADTSVDVEEPPEPQEPVATNPFVIAAHDPLSTFGADVDTASYDIFRRNLQQFNLLPEKSTVRLEEWINYFHYDYPVPPADAHAPFTVNLDAARSPLTETTILRVGLRAMDAPLEDIKPANLVFLVDVSGSMDNASKLPLVKVVLKEALTVLQPTDTVAIVTYSSQTSVRLGPTPISSSQTIIGVIDSLKAGGSTNGSDGITMAYEQAQAGYLEGGVNHVILCTDGDFNFNITSTSGLVDLITEKRKTGITLTALGFGYGNLNDAMMERVSNAGNGVYSVITDADQAVAYAHQRLLSQLYFVAKDLKIQVEMNPEHIYAYRLLGYELNAIADVDFTNDKVDAGEIGAGHTVTALYELVLQGQNLPDAVGAPAPEDGPPAGDVLTLDSTELVKVRIRWKDVQATEDDPAYQTEAVMIPGQVDPALADARPDLQWAVAVAAFAEVLKGSPYAQPGSLDVLSALVDANVGTDPDRLEFQALFAQARGLLGH